MKRNPSLYPSLRLALLASLMLGKVALADETSVASEATTTKRMIVAMADIQPDTAAAPRQELDAAVLDALETVSVDNKVELDLRLADPKSILLVAAR